MSSSFGNNIKITLFGESHSSCVGMVVDGLKPGIAIDEEYLNNELKNRRISDEFSTERKEEDHVEFLSGFFNGFTTGGPLTFIIKNNNQKSSDYVEGVMRPSHSDLSAYLKYNGYNDYRGGGMFSGRMTAPIIVLGALIKQILNKENIFVHSHISSLGEIEDESFSIDKINEQLINLSQSSLKVINKQRELLMREKLKEVKNRLDSIGGCVQTIVLGLPFGVGEPYFDGIESYLAHLIFSIGGVKGIIFGNDNVGKMLASNYNDQLEYQAGEITFLSNNAGGINGGISNSNYLYFKTLIKPTPSIKMSQKSINVLKKENISLNFQGRFDTIIVHRILPVINALTYYALYDLMLSR